MKYVKSLDGLRAVAILLVMLFHFYYTLAVGWIGVQLFFVLSGFLITSILLDTKAQGLSTYLKRFYWRRMLRIFPLYYIYILLVLGIFWVTGSPGNMMDILPYLLSYTYNFVAIVQGFEIDTFFTHFWSLAIEEQFYLFWPLLIFFLNRKKLKIMLIAIIILAPVIRFYFSLDLLLDLNLSRHVIGELTYRLTPAQFDSFAFGALIPVFDLKKVKKSYSKLFQFILFAIVAICIWNYYSIKTINPALSATTLGLPVAGLSNYQHVWSYSLIGIASAIAILFFIPSEQESRLWKNIRTTLFENKIMVEIGKVSYGLYVYHWIILAFYRKMIHPKIQLLIPSFLCYLLIVFVVSYASFHLIEKRFLKLKDTKFNS